MAISRTIPIKRAPVLKEPKQNKRLINPPIDRRRLPPVEDGKIVLDPRAAPPKLVYDQGNQSKPKVIGKEDADVQSGLDDDAEALTRLLPGVNKNSLRRLRSVFGQRSDLIVDLLETENTDGALTLITRTLLQTIIDVLPVIERNVRVSRGSRGVIPLNQTINQIRELVGDIQAQREKKLVGNSVVEKFIRPAYLDLAVQIQTAFLEIENRAKNKMDADEFSDYQTQCLQLMKNNLSKYMTQQYTELKESFVRTLG